MSSAWRLLPKRQQLILTMPHVRQTRAPPNRRAHKSQMYRHQIAELPNILSVC